MCCAVTKDVVAAIALAFVAGVEQSNKIPTQSSCRRYGSRSWRTAGRLQPVELAHLLLQLVTEKESE